MIIKCEKERNFQFSVLPPLYLPFYNRWGRNAYYKYEPFSYDPFNIKCSSTSGSPVVLSCNGFFGFLNEAGGEFSYDGKGTLTVKCRAGQELYYNESCNPYDVWLKYNKIVLRDFEKNSTQSFWSGLEYCTWVDQKRFATQQGKANMQACLNEQFVYDYMRRVDQMGLPKGKLTIDDGWDVLCADNGRRIYGNWQINREKFPHMEQLVKDMTNNGFQPGLWFAPFTFTTDCELAKKYPDLVGDMWNKNSENGMNWTFIKPSPVLEAYYTDIFSRYISMGFRKLKLDISYGKKSDMKELLKMMYRIIKKIDPTFEVEAHVPDIFVSRYCDTVRINDVSFDDEGEWRGVTMEHYKVCRYSASDKILNLDHLGTNTPIPREEDFMEHTKMLLCLKGGYPCVSLLPDLFGQKATDAFVGEIREWYTNHLRAHMAER
ncbi:MAG: alpha-galactosidase [Clostridia bacterium]|nr:alpha-galactosidase [Clostridia bacterium]